MAEVLYLVIPPGETSERQMVVNHPWTGPTTTMAPNIKVIWAPLMINPSSGELAHGWDQWRLDGGVLYQVRAKS
ncbi:hypothetical protein OVA14_10560 [Agrococcus sp. SL85]|uniref:hypothetical protein n=1 Tax=Agrococcus sp. SL85 TaxID=2995141 RepID=UPI00226CF1F1|nr:hypothetical protein [Agrococcus sp. SL85]WAC65759.1 hypothetical protein OVA14_10560 [Agrococcus sp. SL85]